MERFKLASCVRGPHIHHPNGRAATSEEEELRTVRVRHATAASPTLLLYAEEQFSVTFYEDS